MESYLDWLKVPGGKWHLYEGGEVLSLCGFQEISPEKIQREGFQHYTGEGMPPGACKHCLYELRKIIFRGNKWTR